MRMLKKKKFYLLMKRVLVFSISAQISLSHVYAQPYNSSAGNDIETTLVSKEDRQIKSFITKFEDGSVSSISNKEFDVFNLGNQNIELFDQKKLLTYNLNSIQVQIPNVVYTALRYTFDSSHKAFVIEALRGGHGAEQTGAIVVAKHTIPNLDILAVNFDSELIQMVDTKGNVHAIDVGYVVLNAFKNPIPVFKNLVRLDIPGNMTRENIEVGFLTRGTHLSLMENTLLPRGEKGEIILSAGDFYVSHKGVNGGDREAIAILSKDVTLNRMVQGYKILEFQSRLVSPKIENVTLAKKMIENLDQAKEKNNQTINDYIAENRVDPVTEKILESINEKSILDFSKRQESLNYDQKTQDKFSVSDWKSSYFEIKSNYQKYLNESKMQEQSGIDQLEREINWYKYINKVEGQSIVTQKSQFQLIGRLRKSIFSTDNSMKIIATIAGVSSVIYLGFPYVHDYYLNQEQIKMINWTYENFYPEVLKDATYRTPLLLSMASLIAIWPEAVALSALTSMALKKMAENLKDKSTKSAIYIKDLAKNWVPLNNWQRINSFGLRIYASLILPYWRITIENMLKQKTFFSAVNNKMNPFQKISANSEIAKELKISEDMRLGINSILNSDLSSEAIQNKISLQNLKAEQILKIEKRAMQVAAALLANEYKIDPASVIQIVTNQDKMNIDLMSSAEKQKEWTVLTDMLLKDVAEFQKQNLIIDKHMDELIAKYVETGAKALNKISSLPGWKLKLENRKIEFQKKSYTALKAFMNFAKEDYDFLKKVYTNEFVSKEVQKEFTIDHLMVVGIVSLWGERADLSHPEHLAAKADGFLWTSNAHWFDTVLNTYAHFFVSGSQTALIMQKIKFEKAKNYSSITDYKYVERVRIEGFSKSIKEWTVAISNPLKADLGDYVIQKLIKQTTTVTSGLTIMLLLRYGVWDQPLKVAMAAFLFNFMSATVFYGWIWTPIRRGNQMEEERFEKMKSDAQVARRKIVDGKIEDGRSDLKALYKKHNKEILQSINLDLLSANELLQLSVDHPPIYNKANPVLNWLTSWTGAVGSTILAIPLLVILMDEKLLMDPQLFKKWFAYSAMYYMGSYFLLGKKPWQFYISKWEKVKTQKVVIKAQEKWKSFKNKNSKVQMKTCESIF